MEKEKLIKRLSERVDNLKREENELPANEEGDLYD